MQINLNYFLKYGNLKCVKQTLSMVCYFDTIKHYIILI